MTQTSTRTYDVGGVLRARPFEAGRLGHFGLYVEDVEGAARFYTETLGFHVTDHLDVGGVTGTFLTYNSDHHAMVLIDADTARRRGDGYGRGITINQISFQVATLREVVAAHQMLLAEGERVWRVGRDVPGSNWAVYFIDPDGHTVELFYGMEQIGWDRQSKPLPSFGRFRSTEEPALPQPSELDEVRAVVADGGQLTGGHRWDDPTPASYDVGGVLLPRPFRIVGSGPISLFVEDLDASVAFYRDRMGLGVTEETSVRGHRVVYLRTGTEHHTVTLLPVALRTELGLNPRTTLMAIGMQVGSYRQLRDARDFLLAAGHTLVELPPEVHTGSDYALHVQDPAGHLVQLYYEMEQVGTAGQPLPVAERRPVVQPWPERLEATSETSPNPTFQGPLG